ncbi:WhiB family redox-sensing transcriptional regulator [Salana multivorans]|uniref:WhiB family redox-sensing transcriptional regulator n=1 Tax=Salana multivorans TaxID=120377 RepID=A0A3N2DDL9_9MICO|nr:WhiB family transcriptional regulator [Salana multivorans]ROR97524.1 WhiB family redox-sensing transcriptional regulator [Salana multivorans]
MFSAFTDTSVSGGFSTQTLTLPALPALDVVADLDLVLPCQVPGTIDLWFAERGDDVERAKAMCRECPLRAECLAGAVRRQEPWGVWGGEVFIDGVVVARKRGRGRPRKVAA